MYWEQCKAIMVESTLLTLINLENNRVVYQSEPQFRSDPESLNKVLVRNNNGQMAPISQFVTLVKVFGPQAIDRFNLFTSVKSLELPNEGIQFWRRY
jgi:multidrug efflux pump subunit AcrB